VSRAAAAALALAFAACGPWATSYQRDSPRRLDVHKTASAPVLRWTARRTGTTVELIAKHERDVRVTRTLHYTALVAEFRSNHNPFYELLDMALALTALPFPASWWPVATLAPGDTESRKFVIHNSQTLAGINPLQTGIFGMSIDQVESDADVFADPPRVRDYRVRLPAVGVAVTCAALDDAEQVIASIEVTTDRYGRATLAEVPATAIALRLTAEGTTAIIALEEDRP
jgi:hypothetical protein